MPAKKTKRKVPRKAPAKRVKRANAKTAASTRATRPVNGSLSIPANLKEKLARHAKAAGATNWKRFATDLIEQGMAKA